MTDDSGDVTDLLRRAADGDDRAAEVLFARYRDRLKRMVHLRLSRRLQGRVDDSDVLQEAFLDASRRLQAKAGAGSRYLRAIRLLRDILSRIPGFEPF
jgi:DNA-directed RNA polymerase specialized sigma24 family protein